MLAELSGKTALVTGAASGIGRGVAEELGARGMRLIVSDIDEASLAGVAAVLTASGVEHVVAALDIRDAAAWEALLDGPARSLGPVQLLCNIAGVTVAPTPLLDLPVDGLAWVMETNLTGTFNGVAAVGRRLRMAGLPGHIVTTSSVQGLFGAAGFGAYNASKFAIMGLSETLRLELAPHDIGVSVVCPGPTRGNFMANSHRIAPHLVKLDGGRARGGFTHMQSPAEVAVTIVDAVERNRFFVLTHGEYRPVLEARWAALDAALGTGAEPEAVDNIRGNEAAILALYAEEAGKAVR